VSADRTRSTRERAFLALLAFLQMGEKDFRRAPQAWVPIVLAAAAVSCRMPTLLAAARPRTRRRRFDLGWHDRQISSLQM